MGYVVVFIFVVLIIEFFFMVASYDDFFDNIGWSLFWGVIVTIIIAAVVEHEPCEGDACNNPEQQQEQQLQEQWSDADNLVDDLVIQDDLIGRVKQEIAERNNYVEDENASTRVETKPVDERVVPSNRSYIEDARRDTRTTVIYNKETRQACGSQGCYKANLIQHTDGTFWACKRNYGTCYEY